MTVPRLGYPRSRTARLVSNAQLLASTATIEHWLRSKWQDHAAPFYCSVDLRNSGFKLARSIPISSRQAAKECAATKSDTLTEVNVTSPTCFQAITDQTGFNVAGMMVDALEHALR